MVALQNKLLLFPAWLLKIELLLQVRSRIEGNGATVKKQAEGKRVFNFSNHGFVMRKCSSKLRVTCMTTTMHSIYAVAANACLSYAHLYS